MNSLLIHQGALGDWVLTFPLLRALAKESDAVLVAAAAGKARLAVRLIPGLQALDVERGESSRLHAADAAEALSGWWRRELGSPELIVSFVADPQEPWAENVRCLAPDARVFFVRPRPPADWLASASQWHLMQLRQQGLTLAPVDPAPCHNPAGPVVVHPGAGSPSKCWSRERFERLIGELRQRGLPVRAVLGEVELETWPAHVLSRWREQFAAEPSATLDALVDAIAAARLWIGNDSGPTHLAAQMGLPAIAIFGPSSPVQWSPRGPQVTVLAPPAPAAMDWLSPDVVLDACERLGRLGVQG